MSMVRSGPFSTVEQQFGTTSGGISDEEFRNMKDWFDQLPYPSFKMSDADKARLKALMPNLDMALVDDCEVKPKGGVCACGRQITLLDLITKALSRSSHSVAFLEQVFGGKKGKWVIVGLHHNDKLTLELKSKYPANTLYVEGVDFIPCVDCGREQDVVLYQAHVLHPWGTV